MGKRMVVHPAGSLAEGSSSNWNCARPVQHRKLDVSRTYRGDEPERPRCAISSFRCM